MKIQHKYQYVLFDWDGCLADTLSIWMEAYLHFYHEYGVTVTEADVMSKSWGNWEKGPLNLGVKDNIGFINKISKRVIDRRLEVKLHEGVKPVLNKLFESGKKMAIVSSSMRIQVVDPLKKLGLEKFFPIVLSAEDVVNYKPHPEVVEKAMSRLGATNSETIIIGDSGSDVKAGKAAYIKTAIFYPEINHRFYSKEDLKALNPDYFILNFADILG
ncbi:hypothetical protein A2X44_00585 [candidate division CPR3 bacterium GWF2_35_18]|uniref:Pyrophosphatase PpaX n=1 Tax=candidate division CPR3 bacterium GW2011_GWF2_35_18 TaxID=1618350 RepID=A0A0G0E4C3_UNCC3|nr:MAG: Pyrophosphatase PpaX [candidate division CPR3 bacterium GW2011_GWF2_35_18]OGB63410.1 MAG: hypothetical protein A2X44_00585 [candidate division CPR3 bacterium GWF2_35_18]OGB64845.1 MAG: hypothetical protein A2250_05445 [candidate division CPR3 bacterium RIFOXYA2_FULL_35_13]OGB76115.1 MAG: hypothetical protein A2476_05565 [candidate division CPR3 bacterium RIFOXYC2_FULL_35_7]OGB78965.1 MAG: hypothetical protein A2296_04550 [candidate division CPR3 bacterium RIFOXYB2_FULL_35_8]